jgi:hypothetical protein
MLLPGVHPVEQINSENSRALRSELRYNCDWQNSACTCGCSVASAYVLAVHVPYQLREHLQIDFMFMAGD